MSPWVLHIDIDAFFASVEQLRNPRLAGRPVAVGTGVIASCSYEARRFGLHAGMPLRKAREVCPRLLVLPGHAAIYRCFSERVFQICRSHTPAVETYLDEAFCDLAGTERLHPDVLSAAARLKERIREETGLSTTVGLGRSRMVAKMAARSVKPDGLRRLEAVEEDGFLRDLPLRELPGVGPRAGAILGKLNIRTIGDLRLLSRPSLVGIFGRVGDALYQRCRGIDTRAICAREVPRSIGRETSFAEETTDAETIEGTLYYLTERAAATLRQLGLRASQIEVKIRYRDHETASVARKLAAPTQLDSELFERAAALRRAIHTRRAGLRLVGITLGRLVPETGYHQLDLFSDAPIGSSIADVVADVHRAARSIEARRRERRLLLRIDAIRERYGYSSVVCGRSLRLLGQIPQDEHGFVLRTPCLTR